MVFSLSSASESHCREANWHTLIWRGPDFPTSVKVSERHSRKLQFVLESGFFLPADCQVGLSLQIFGLKQRKWAFSWQEPKNMSKMSFATFMRYFCIKTSGTFIVSSCCFLQLCLYFTTSNHGWILLLPPKLLCLDFLKATHVWWLLSFLEIFCDRCMV